jgi:hypothetical protein
LEHPLDNQRSHQIHYACHGKWPHLEASAPLWGQTGCRLRLVYVRRTYEWPNLNPISHRIASRSTQSEHRARQLCKATTPRNPGSGSCEGATPERRDQQVRWHRTQLQRARGTACSKRKQSR